MIGVETPGVGIASTDGTHGSESDTGSEAGDSTGLVTETETGPAAPAPQGPDKRLVLVALAVLAAATVYGGSL
ncbi:hypothetical protein [Halosimplex amylolyticum]|uniref:hypothetical protein n=1 Tax=Halosimplex amylolyticum TaxID=3396616 RepID=UPI003F57C87F